MRMNRHDDSQRSGRLVTQPAAAYHPPLSNSLYEKQLTAPADRPHGDPARAVAGATVVAIGGAGSVHRRTGMRAARALPGDRNVPDPRLLTAGKTHAALPANQIRCFADHHSMVAHHPVWGCDPDAHVRGAVGACMIGSHTRITSYVYYRPKTDNFCQASVRAPCSSEKGVQNDTQRTARARGVSPGEPGESHAARFSSI